MRFVGSNNLVAKWTEFDKFKETPKLEELLFVGNPIHEAHKDTVRRALLYFGREPETEVMFVSPECWQQDYRIQIAGRIPWLKKLDGTPIDDDEREQGKTLVNG